MYPRKRYFDEITRVFADRGASYRLFNDKYFAYEWTDAKPWPIVSAELEDPVCLRFDGTLAWQRPPLELPRGTEVRANCWRSVTAISKNTPITRSK